LVVGLVTYALLLFAASVDARLRFIAAWDIGATFALIALFFGLRNSSAATMKQLAARQDAGKWAVLVLSLVAATASLVKLSSQIAPPNPAATECWPQIGRFFITSPTRVSSKLTLSEFSKRL